MKLEFLSPSLSFLCGDHARRFVAGTGTTKAVTFFGVCPRLHTRAHAGANTAAIRDQARRGGMRNEGDALASTPEDAEVDAGDVVGEVVKQPKDAPSRDEPPSMGWLARYCRHCERNPWTGFLSVFFTVLVMAVVVGAFGLARFDTENDKVGARPPRVPRAPRSFIRHIPFREIPFCFGTTPPNPRVFVAMLELFPTFPDYANHRAHRRSGSYSRTRSPAEPTPRRLRSSCATDPSAKSPARPSYRGRRSPRARR